jgi:hypothetical protein
MFMHSDHGAERLETAFKPGFIQLILSTCTPLPVLPRSFGAIPVCEHAKEKALPRWQGIFLEKHFL